MTWDTIVIGSGFGGAMAARPLVHAGQRVLMIERGSWVSRGPESWGARGAGLVTPHYTLETPIDVRRRGRRTTVGTWNCVGGQSVFYGGASYRFRETDFEHDADLVADSGAAWPFGYAELEPYYSEAERLLGVAGECGAEPTEPARSAGYSQRPAPLAASSRRIVEAATRLGLHPSRIPLAIARVADTNRRACVRCGTCDGYACAAEAKNDVATAIIPDLMARGMTLRVNLVCVRLVRSGSRVTRVECIHRLTGERETFAAHQVMLAAGTLATPHLLLSSNLAAVNPAAHAVGRYLTLHRNIVVFGVFPCRPNPEKEFDKQVAIFDFYAEGGCLQQMTPPVGLVRAYLPRIVRAPAAKILSHALGLVVIAEDQPQECNAAEVCWARLDRYGLPTLRVRHWYSDRDERVARRLARHAGRILRESGALLTFNHPIETFTHALGSVRMGVDERTSPLDGYGRYRGLDNLYVTDGSALPRSAGVNPSLTIAANALRVGTHLASSSAREHSSPRRAVAARRFLRTVPLS